MALLLKPEKYGENVKKYLDWYLSHLNTAETDVSGVDGTMYDYDLTFSADGKEVTEKVVVNDTTKENHYDSTDAYAAITLKILWDYAQACNDEQYIESCKVVEQTEEEAFVAPDPSEVSGAPKLGGKDDITAKGSIICSVMPENITGTGNKDIEIIRSGSWVNALAATNTSQYDTFTGKKQKEGYVGIDYGSETYRFTSFAFQEGMHFGNGGWFSEQPKIQVKVNGEWVDVKNQKCEKAYRRVRVWGFRRLF